MNLSASAIVCGLVFGAVGFSAFIYGKKMASAKHMLLGIALMGYTYLVSDPIWMVVVGVGLTAGLFFGGD